MLIVRIFTGRSSDVVAKIRFVKA
ncbi:Hypothetical protein LLA12_00778 [Lactococcus lactis subsp. lactis]|nr:Hypothetical protein LLA12_00778 [Lactococcus lactis subsp. lactis]